MMCSCYWCGGDEPWDNKKQDLTITEKAIVDAASKWHEVKKALASDLCLEDQMEWISRIEENE